MERALSLADGEAGVCDVTTRDRLLVGVAKTGISRDDAARSTKPMEPQPASPPTSSAKLVPFGKYLLLERVAIGGMAEVWLAKRMTDDGASELLALKRILPHLSADAEFIRMFVDEARIAGQLQHSGIVPTQELGRIGQSFYIVMEYVWGRDLLQLLRHVKQLGQMIDPIVCAHIGSKLCEALHYAHTKDDKSGKPLRLVHRDVSPQNVLLSFDGVVKLIDFGIAKAASRSTSTQVGTLKGKVGYMSPEAVRGLDVDARSDIFAVGTLLYEMLTVRPLFARGNNFEAMNRVRTADVPPLMEKLPTCPQALADVVMRALSLRPEDRFQNADEMRRALDGFLSTVVPCTPESIAGWLHTIYEGDYSREKARIMALDSIGRRAVTATTPMVSTPVPPRTPVPAVPRPMSAPPPALASDATVVAKPISSPPVEKPPSKPASARPMGEASPTEVFFHREEIVRVGEPNPDDERIARPLKGLFRPGKANAVDTFRAPLVSRSGDSQRPPAMTLPMGGVNKAINRETIPSGGIGARPNHAPIGDSYEEEATSQGEAIRSTHSLTNAGREAPEVASREVAGLPSFTVQRGKILNAAERPAGASSENDDDDETFDDIGVREPLVPPSVVSRAAIPISDAPLVSVPGRRVTIPSARPLSAKSLPPPSTSSLRPLSMDAPPDMRVATLPPPSVVSAPVPVVINNSLTPQSSAITQALEAMALESKPISEDRPSGFALDAHSLDSQIIKAILPQVANPVVAKRGEPTESFRRDVRHLTTLRARYSGLDYVFFGAVLVLTLALGGVASLTWAEATRPYMLRISGTPVDALVLLDGAPRGHSPLQLEVTEGTHQLTLVRDGYVETSRQIEATGDLDVVLHLAPLPAPTPTP